MRHLLLFGHIFGFVLWMGGGFGAMTLGIAARSAQRSHLAALVGVQGKVFRGMILPGSLLTVICGLLLTLRLGSAVGATGFSVPLMVMQGAGLLGAVIVLVVVLPTNTRLGRLDPTGEQAPLFEALSKRAAIAGSLVGVLALTALVCGVLLR